MTVIKDILEVEEEAKKIITDAHNTARTLVEDAKEKSIQDVSSFKNGKESERVTKTEEQKKELVSQYKSILDKGQKDIEKSEAEIDMHHKKAVTQVIEQLSK